MANNVKITNKDLRNAIYFVVHPPQYSDPSNWIGKFTHDVSQAPQEILNGVDSSSGDTLLTYACFMNCSQCVDVLIRKREVNVNLPDKSGKTGLWHAAYMGHLDIINILLERDDLNLNLKNKTMSSLWMKTPLAIAIEKLAENTKNAKNANNQNDFMKYVTRYTEIVHVLTGKNAALDDLPQLTPTSGQTQPIPYQTSNGGSSKRSHSKKIKKSMYNKSRKVHQ
jgi:ankyrin repeat protein